MENYCKQILIHYKLLMRTKLLLFAILFANCSWATDFVFPGNAVAPLSLQNNDTLSVDSGTFDGGTTFTVMNGPTTTGQSVTIDAGATLSSNAFAIYAPYNGPFTILNNGTLSGSTSAVQGPGSNITFTQGSAVTIDGLLTFGPSATVNFNSAAGSNNFLYVGANSTINFNSTGSPLNGIVGATGTTVNINNSISLAPMNLIATININHGTTNLGNVTNLTSALNVASGATLALGSNTISGTGTITQAGTFTSSSTSALTGYTGIFTSSGTSTLAAQTLNSDFRVTGGTTSVTGVGSLIINNTCTLSGGTFDTGQSTVIINNNATMHQTGGIFKINSSGVTGSFQIVGGGSFIMDGGTFDRGAGGATSWNNSTFTLNGGTVNYANGITINGGNFSINGGLFNYTAATAINITSATITITGGTFTGSAGSLFVNPGSTINVSGGTLDFAQNVFVTDHVNIFISGQPTIKLEQGQTFLSNNNVVLNIAFGPSSIPKIQFPNTGIDFTNPVLNVTNNNNVFIASGDYIIVDAAGLIIPGVVHLPANTQFQQYSLGESAGGFGVIAFVRVVRTGLNTGATTPISQSMGSFLDQVAASLGSSNPNSILFTAISAIENAANTAAFNQDLFEISPQSDTIFPALSNIDMLFQQIDTHLLATRGKKYYVAGDELYKNDVWLAPFGRYARQSTHELLNGYVAKSAGFTLGAERQITTTSLVGIAGSYINGRIEPTDNRSSHTNMRTYQVTGYGTFNVRRQQHLDWIAAYNTNMNYNYRNIEFMNAASTAKFNTNLYGGKLIYSNDMLVSKRTTVSPELNLQYVHLQQQGYFEAGADGLDYNVSPTHTTLLRIGAGGWITYMQKARCHRVVPQLYAAVTVDAISASQNISANFVNTAPVLNTQAKTPRFGGIVGSRMTYMLRDNLFIIGNINVQGKIRYIDAYGDLRLKYYF